MPATAQAPRRGDRGADARAGRQLEGVRLFREIDTDAQLLFVCFLTFVIHLIGTLA
jgi:hypothetical protein